MSDQRDAMDSGESNQQSQATASNRNQGVAMGIVAAEPVADDSSATGSKNGAPEAAGTAADSAVPPPPMQPTPALQLVTRTAYILETFESFVTWLACPNGMQAISGGYDGLPDGWSASRSTPARDANGALNGVWAYRFHGPAPGAPVGVTLTAFCTAAPITTTAD